ncbi:MAG: hypothetical protein LIR40_08105 [Bacteroidota bacterium]|nr:hypothetical protein [Bacteroidota bacterium]
MSDSNLFDFCHVNLLKDITYCYRHSYKEQCSDKEHEEDFSDLEKNIRSNRNCCLPEASTIVTDLSNNDSRHDHIEDEEKKSQERHS